MAKVSDIIYVLWLLFIAWFYNRMKPFFPACAHFLKNLASKANTKISSQKLSSAVTGLLKSDVIKILSGKSDGDFVNACDKTIRILLAQYRSCVRSPSLQHTSLGKLASEDRLKALFLFFLVGSNFFLGERGSFF